VWFTVLRVSHAADTELGVCMRLLFASPSNDDRVSTAVDVINRCYGYSKIPSSNSGPTSSLSETCDRRLVPVARRFGTCTRGSGTGTHL